ncbi:DUF2024 family protein [Marinirhabdus gelatinilytica]|uniref:Uncharacterized protein DUF2024 n=1 Tax=Marinirhabdus gelatinilytica TaxID=1703343 RepID=A0A370QLG8_9FLAO|nr:DUF2024 family protein [Marinirhabdus gelatinilytica]RDK89192.1 uncharacterized protein DUF2024 [Marinirhabdus gelatinilytica]
MKIAIWDTYVQRKDGKTMHFDILVPRDLKDEQTIFDFGKNYLQSKQFSTGELTAGECRFCHIENATQEMIESIKKNGYAIIEMENCN